MFQSEINRGNPIASNAQWLTKNANAATDDISLIPFIPTLANTEITSQLVECYRDVFAASPWGEWLKCSVCENYWGLEDKEYLSSQNYACCAKPLVDFWPKNQVLADLKNEITPEATCWLAMDAQRLVGFSWGYSSAVAKLEKKLGITFATDKKGGKGQVVAYLDEIGVISDYRDRKIAKALITQNFKDFAAQGLGYCVLRTRKSPTPAKTFLWFTRKLGFRVLTAYSENDGRVILGGSLSNLSLTPD